MKKYYFKSALVAVVIGTMVMFACSKDKDESKSCTCTEYSEDYDEHSEPRTLDPSSFGATNCSDLEIKLRIEAGDGYYYSCH